MSSTVLDRTEPPQDETAAELDRLVRAITDLEAVVSGGDLSQAATMQALKIGDRGAAQGSVDAPDPQ